MVTFPPLANDAESGSDIEDVPFQPTVRQSFGLMAGEHVPLALKQKIISGKDIDMYDLLEESVTKERALYMVQPKSGGKPKWVRDSTPSFITIEQWNEAFASFMAIYHTTAKNMQESHNLILSMLTYQLQINSMAKVGKPWWKYDVQFR